MNKKTRMNKMRINKMRINKIDREIAKLIMKKRSGQSHISNRQNPETSVVKLTSHSPIENLIYRMFN